MSATTDYSELWNKALDATGLSDRVIFVLGTLAAHLLTFWIYNFVLYIISRNNWFQDQRTQPTAKLQDELLKKAFWKVVTSHFVAKVFGLYFVYPLFEYYGTRVRGPLPDVSVFVRDFAVSFFVNDTMFYWVHRLLHHKALYKYIHKQHHEITVPWSFASEYFNPVDDFVSNQVPTVLGTLLTGSHVITWWIWLAFRIGKAVDSHSGYNFKWSIYNTFPFCYCAEKHDFHHSHNVGCYGSTTLIWDTLMGTDKDFYEFKAKQLMVKKSSSASAEVKKGM